VGDSSQTKSKRLHAQDGQLQDDLAACLARIRLTIRQRVGRVATARNIPLTPATRRSGIAGGDRFEGGLAYEAKPDGCLALNSGEGEP
jgi:hypothetical protein